MKPLIRTRQTLSEVLRVAGGGADNEAASSVEQRENMFGFWLLPMLFGIQVGLRCCAQ